MRLVFEKLKSAFESKWLILPLFFVELVLQSLGLYSIGVLILAIVLALILLFCDDVKNIFAIIFYVSFFIGNIFINANWFIYGTAIAIAGVSFIYFVISRIIKRKLSGEKFKTSRIFIPLVIISVIYCLGGAISNFQLVPFIVTIGFSLAVLFFVFVASNYANNLKRYLPFLFTVGAITILIEMLITNAVEGKSILTIFTVNPLVSVGAQNINVAALYMLIGLISCFALGYKKKNSHLYLILATIIAAGIIVSICRMIILLAFLSYAFLSIYSLTKLKRKTAYVITLSIMVFFIVGFIVLDLLYIKDIIVFILYKIEGSNFFSGRIRIWSWCVDKFKENPLLGVGFVHEEIQPILNSNPTSIILAHNTLIQWLVSLGALGTLFMLAFTVCKYKIVAKSVKECGIFIPLILYVITLSGITDQAAQMDIFVYAISLITLVSIDDCSPLKTLLPLKKRKLRGEN